MNPHPSELRTTTEAERASLARARRRLLWVGLILVLTGLTGLALGLYWVL